MSSYTGEVVIRAYDGEWIEHEQASGAYAVRALGVTGFPFAFASKVLDGQDLKALGSFGRSFPAIAANAQNAAPHYPPLPTRSRLRRFRKR